MRYVKIKAKNYNEAMMKLKMEHGDDAIPISHKYVKEGGLFNSKFLAKDMVELTAAVPERNPLARKKPEIRSTIDFTVGDNGAGPVPSQKVVPEQVEPWEKHRKEAAARQTIVPSEKSLESAPQTMAPQTMPRKKEKEMPAADTPRHSVGADDTAYGRLEKEFMELKETLNKMLEAQGRDAGKIKDVLTEEDLQIKPFRDLLLNSDFDRQECEIILGEVRNSVSRDDLRDRFKIEKTLKEFLKSRIVTSGPIKMGNRKKIVMFIGPTGVGKTTTMAKLGAIYSLRETYRVAFVTIDNYRIAATEQLKKYAEIMRIPVHVVNDQKNFKEIIESEKADIIMVDTSGRSHKNDLKISEIKSYADMVEYELEKILCVSANTKRNDLSQVFKSFDKMNFHSVIVTKVDETTSIGNVIEITDRYKKPISYVTCGQEVPNDIDVADPDKIVNMIIGGVN